MGKRLCRQKFDITINLHENERTFVLCLLAYAQTLIGTASKVMRMFLDVYTSFNIFMHASDHYIDILNQLGINDTYNYGLQVVISAE